MIYILAGHGKRIEAVASSIDLLAKSSAEKKAYFCRCATVYTNSELPLTDDCGRWILPEGAQQAPRHQQDEFFKLVNMATREMVLG